MNNNKQKILIATGGTGGHTLPAVGLFNFLDEKIFNFILTTDERGLKFIDKTVIKDKLFIINSSPLKKEEKIRSIFRIILSIIKSFFLLTMIKPKLIFGMGGYASFPVCFAAIFLRIPFVIYENNLIIGKVNRLLIPFAKKILVSYGELDGVSTKYKNKISLIGNILRENIISYSKKRENNYDKLKILVLGGSQAAQKFAEKLPNIFIQYKKKGFDFKIYQQCLPNQIEQLKLTYKENKIDNELFTFTFDIINYYNSVDLAITRAGASALAELLNCKIPIISIPLSSSAENHQYKNAKYFEKKGYSFLIEEKNIDNELFNLLHSFHEDKSILNKMIQNQKKYNDKDVFNKIEKEIVKIIYEN